MAPRGISFNSGDQSSAMCEVLSEVELYRSTLEWVHYQGKSEVTATEIGQYWESSHTDTLGSLRGSTLKDGAVTFGRVIEGAGLGTFTIGRGGKETRIAFGLPEVERVIVGTSVVAVETTDSLNAPAPKTAAPIPKSAAAAPAPPPEIIAAADVPEFAPSAPPIVSVSASPSVHVNVEIHIAADATADTVREIFRNMARYVLDKHVEDDDN